MVRQIKGKDCENGKTQYNSIFQKDEGNFYKKTREISTYKGQLPTMDKFAKFWAGIWEDQNETPNKKWMEKIKKV